MRDIKKTVEEAQKMGTAGIKQPGKAKCPRCAAAGLDVCMCPPPSGGSGGESGDESGSDNTNYSGSGEDSSASKQAVNMPDLIPYAPIDENYKNSIDQQLQINVIVINELLSRHLLEITLNEALMTLTIECNPRLVNSLSKEQTTELNKLLLTIQKEFEDFKKKYNIEDKYCLTELKNDSKNNLTFLSIQLTNPKYLNLFEKFIEQLINKNLLPTQNIHNQEKAKLYPTPLAMRPTFSHKKPNPDEDKHETKRSKRSPLSLPSIKDGPKPPWEKH